MCASEKLNLLYHLQSKYQKISYENQPCHYRGLDASIYHVPWPHCNVIFCRFMHLEQILWKRGPFYKLEVEANFKPLMSKSNRSSISISQILVNRNDEFYPGSKLLKYHHAYTNTTSYKSFFLIVLPQIGSRHINYH